SPGRPSRGRSRHGSGRAATAPDVDTAAAISPPRSRTGAITSVDPADGFAVVPFEQRLAALRV
ncbi:hypothetical protein SF23_20930, partial [Streptomyces sp. MBRL 10]